MLKKDVHDFWQQESCGEVYATGDSAGSKLQSQALARYELEPYIPGFARFEEGRGLSVLEIGVGMGADHLEWARHRPRRLVGLDATNRALEHTRSRLTFAGCTPVLLHADAERLPFQSDSFDVVYSWGVLHHTPDTPGAIREVLRVLRPGGTARVMIYHRRSIVGFLLWLKYALLPGRPFRSLDDIYAHHLESRNEGVLGGRCASAVCQVRDGGSHAVPVFRGSAPGRRARGTAAGSMPWCGGCGRDG